MSKTDAPHGIDCLFDKSGVGRDSAHKGFGRTLGVSAPSGALGPGRLSSSSLLRTDWSNPSKRKKNMMHT